VLRGCVSTTDCIVRLGGEEVEGTRVDNQLDRLVDRRRPAAAQQEATSSARLSSDRGFRERRPAAARQVAERAWSGSGSRGGVPRRRVCRAARARASHASRQEHLRTAAGERGLARRRCSRRTPQLSISAHSRRRRSTHSHRQSLSWETWLDCTNLAVRFVARELFDRDRSESGPPVPCDHEGERDRVRDFIDVRGD
jgi:hypothetical protein